ncbi:RNaseH domain-containing protein, partial [Scytonema sp. NUACC21]
SRAISELLKMNDSLLPDPNTLASKPVYNWSGIGENPNSIIQAALAYDSRHRGDIPCLPGVSPLDVASLDSAIQHKIKQENVLVRRVGEAVKKSGTYKPYWEPGKPRKKGSQEPKDRNDLSTPMQRPKIAAPATFRSSENSPNMILILWETQECRDALIAEICELLLLSQKGETKTYETLPGVTGKETIYESPYGCLHIKTQHVLDLTQIFDVDNPSVEGKNRQQRRMNLMDKRIHQIISYLPKPEKFSGALIEIPPKPFIPESDPKLALRIGAMQAGYVNQHIHALTRRKKDGSEYITKEAPNRVQKAVSDLLRQFGILPVPLIDITKDGIDPNMWLTCFYVLRRTRKTTANNMASTVAIVVRVNPVTGIVQLTTPSLFPNPGWVSYPDGLGYLLHEKWNPNSYADDTTDDMSDKQQSSNTKSEQQFFNNFVTECLRDCLNTPVEGEKLPRVLLMAEAQNARKMLTWLQNPKDKLPANDLPDALKLHMSESEISRLLLVRLRVAGNGGEVPVGIVKGSPGSRTSGLFCWQDVCDDGETALYLSVRKLLNTEQGTNTLKPKQSRLDNGSLQAGNPKPLEIAVIHHPGIDRDKLACFVHSLRDRWPYFANEVSLPIPFPFATLAKEYAVSALDAAESVDLDEAEDSEESFD